MYNIKISYEIKKDKESIDEKDLNIYEIVEKIENILGVIQFCNNIEIKIEKVLDKIIEL